jgi:hypothetical protein
MSTDESSSISIYRAAQQLADDLRHPESAQRLEVELEIAWWRGKISGSGVTRLGAMRALYGGCRDVIRFRVVRTGSQSGLPIGEAIEKRDEIVVIDLGDSIPIPSEQPWDWSEADCGPALNAIAEQWRSVRSEEGPIGAIVMAILAVKIEREDLRRWWSQRSVVGDRKPSGPGGRRRATKGDVHNEAVKLLASSMIEDKHGSHAHLVDALTLRFPDLSREALRKYSRPAHDAWSKRRKRSHRKKRLYNRNL